MKKTFRSIFVDLIWFGTIAVCLLLPPASVLAARDAGYASDIAPPKITIVSPPKDSQIDTGTPRIELMFFDSLSGINGGTVRLFLDRVEITAKAVIEQDDVTGHAKDSPWHISYTPVAALFKGKHEIRFSVQDLAGNLAEIGWGFEVTVGRSGGFNFSGDNTLQIDASPVKTTMNTLNLAAQGQWDENIVRLDLSGRITDYPGEDPYYSYRRYNFYNDDYALGFYRRQFSTVLGYVNASLDSELLQLGLTMKGGIASDTLDESTGQYHWTVFSGDSGSSYGTDASVYRLTGAGGNWRTNSGLQLGGYYVSLNGDRAYDFAGIRGNASMENLGLFRFEMIHGSSKNGGTSGNGWAFHWDQSFSGTSLGLDYTVSEPDYPEVGSSSLFTSTNRGLRSYGLHALTAINEHQSFSLEDFFSQDNLDHRGDYTETRQNINAGYSYCSNSNFSFNAAYQGDFKNREGSLRQEEENHVVSMGMQQNIGSSQLKVACTLDAARDPDPSYTDDQVQLLTSLICPLGHYNITPSLQWSDEKIEDGDYARWVEVRLTLDRRFYSDLPRSSIALYYRISNELDDDGQSKVIEFGLLPSLYFKLSPHSTLTLIYDYVDWTRNSAKDTEGADKTIRLTWKVEF